MILQHYLQGLSGSDSGWVGNLSFASDDVNNDTQLIAPILFTDDDPDTVMLYRMMMRRAQYKAVFTDNGLEALQICQTESISLVVSDIHKPGLSGLELLAELRSDPTTMHIPVLFVTSSRHVYDRLDEDEYPFVADAVMGKPFDFNDLMEAIRVLVGIGD